MTERAAQGEERLSRAERRSQAQEQVKKFMRGKPQLSQTFKRLPGLHNHVLYSITHVCLSSLFPAHYQAAIAPRVGYRGKRAQDCTLHP